jgi:hypothetical protein
LDLEFQVQGEVGFQVINLKVFGIERKIRVIVPSEVK